MDFSAVCRTCLSKSCLNPIFATDDHKQYSLSILVTTGVKIEINDGMPQKMCTQCINFLNQYLKFRKKCKEVEIELLKLKKQLDNAQNASTNREIDTMKNSNVSKHKSLHNVTEIKLEVLREIKVENTDNEDDKPLKYLLDDASYNQYIELFDNEYSNETYSEIKATENESIETTEIDRDDRDDRKQREIDSQKIQSDKGRVLCKLCLKNLSVRSIAMHMARCHPGADKSKVKCDLCDNYVMEEKMKRHKKMMHESDALECRYCKSEYDTQELLIEHVKICTAKKKKRKINESSRELRECDICHKTMQKASLRTHKAVKHAGLGPVCEVLCLDVPISCMCWLPNNPSVVVLGLTGDPQRKQSLRLYNTYSGRTVEVDGLTGEATVTALAVNQNGTCRVAAGDITSTVHVWDLPTRKIRLSSEDLQF